MRPPPGSPPLVLALALASLPTCHPGDEPPHASTHLDSTGELASRRRLSGGLGGLPPIVDGLPAPGRPAITLRC